MHKEILPKVRWSEQSMSFDPEKLADERLSKIVGLLEEVTELKAEIERMKG